MARVLLDGVTKRYRGADVLHDLDLEFVDGEFTCVLGPSGCGKSTILKLIAGIEEVTSGRILFDDDDITHVTPERRDIAMVFQTYGLYPNMTARGNISFPLMLRKVPQPERDARVEEVADLLGIRGVLDRPPRMLSGGERQRVALGRAIVRDPRVFLLDEPISNLDAHLRATTREELKRIHARLGATFIYVTHDQDDAEAMGDRVVVMASGAVQQVDTPYRTYHWPANRFVASFVGRLPMNQIEGEVTDEAGHAWFSAGEFRFPLGECGQEGVPAPGRMVLGLRPETIVASPAAPVSNPGPAAQETGVAGASPTLTGVVMLTEVVAPDEYAHVQVGAVLVRARMQEGAPMRVGESVRLTITRSRTHFFDPVSGARVGGRSPAARTSDRAEGAGTAGPPDPTADQPVAR